MALVGLKYEDTVIYVEDGMTQKLDEMYEVKLENH